jgi:microcystin-dependent protein
MSEPHVGEIKIFSFGTIPRTWLPCNGQLLPIGRYTALFTLLGTTYGGDGRNTFALPNLQGRLPLHASEAIPFGQAGGELAHALTTAQIPTHAHPAAGSIDVAQNSAPQPSLTLAQADGGYQYAATSSGTAPMSPSGVSYTGGSQPHENMMPYLTLSICICVSGGYPSRP